MHRLSKLLLFILGSLFVGSFGSLSHAATPGEVYLVLGSDTAIWEGMGTSTFHDHYRVDLYTNEQRNAFKVMAPEFRQQFRDSYGQTVKLTWWMMAGNIFRYADNTDVPVPNIMTLYLMKKYHGERIRQHGDELTLHYHTFNWSDYDKDGKFYWNQATNFVECRDDFDFTVAQFLLEENVFPVSFRSGWHYMDNEWQQRLDQLIPFTLHNSYPAKRFTDVEPTGNIYDWSQAPSSFIPFHPSPTNYQRPGSGKGLNVRCVMMGSMSQSLMNGMFAQAAGGTNQVACLWAHLPEVDFLTNIGKMDLLAHTAASNYPIVRFRYCTAVEGMQRWLQTQDQTPPQLQITEQVEGDQTRLILQTDEPIFQTEPFVAVKDLSRHTQIVPCQPSGSNSWTAILPGTPTNLLRAAVALTDNVGNLTTRIINYVEIPEAPSLLITSLLNSNTAELSWMDDSTNETGFLIEQAPAKSGPWTEITTVPANTNRFTLSGLTPFTTYFFRVRALGVDYNSEYSNCSSLITPRLPPHLASIANQTIIQGETLNIQISATSDNPESALFPITNFETEQVGDPEVLFRRPSASTTTTNFLNASSGDESQVTNIFPGPHAGSNVLKCTWQFASGAANPWLRLGTGGAGIYPSPIIDFKQTLQFDIYTDQPLKLGLGVRETDTPAGTLIGCDGGTSGNVEWAGVNGKIGGTPNPIRTLAAGTWHRMEFNFANEKITSFTGNAVLSTPSGLGTLEHLVLLPASPEVAACNIYLDNFVVVFSNRLTFSLAAGPAGATIDSQTGVLSWTPNQSGVFSFTVRVEDTSTPALTDERTFAVTVRPAPLLGAIANKTVAAGEFVSFTVPTTSAANDTLVSVTDFESYSTGAMSVFFARPTASTITTPFVDAAETNYSTVTSNFPSGHASAKVLKCFWAFTNAANPWLRLTTYNSNPVIPITQPLQFDIYSERELKIALGIRETTNATGTPIGSNGGTLGSIEWVGAVGKVGTGPNPIRTIPAGTWQTLRFDIPTEPVVLYTGDGVLETASGLGVLEQLAILPVSNGTGPQTIYLDNFSIVYPKNLRFALDPGAPVGAIIDPASGAFSWVPMAYGTYPLTIHVTGPGTPPVDETASFTVAVLPTLNCRQQSNVLDFTWPANCILQTATNVAGPYVDQVTATNRYSMDFMETQRFFRVRVD